MMRIERGIPALTAYEKVIRTDPSITSVATASYPDPPRAQERHQLSVEDQSILQAALLSKSRTGAPFWDCVLGEALKCGRVSEDLLDAISCHQNLKASAAMIGRADVLAGRLQSLVSERHRELNIALLSCVETTVGPRHFSMMDFACAVSPINEAVVKAIASRLIPGPSIIICSGMSYHAFGLTLVDQSERVAMLGLAVQFGPIVDRSFVSHQLRQGFSALRISGSQNKCLPYVI